MISPVHPHFAASSLPDETTANDPRRSERAEIGEASRQFEAILLRQILSAAHKPAFPSRYNPQSFSNGIYQDFVIERMAEDMSRSGGFGLADRLCDQLTRQTPADKAGIDNQTAQASDSAARLARTRFPTL